MDMDGERKLQALRSVIVDKKGIFFRTFIVAEDGLVDVIEDDNHDSPSQRYTGLRPGLWRSFVRKHDDHCDLSAGWAVWVWDPSSSRELLDQMVGRQEVGKTMRDAIRRRTAKSYFRNLDWNPGGRCPGGSGIAIRSRHVMSPEFYNYLHNDKIEWTGGSLEEQWKQLPEHWRATLKEWFACNYVVSNMGWEEDGAEVGGCAIQGDDGAGFPDAVVKNEQGQTIGILLGDMGPEIHYSSDEYDGEEHEERLEDLSDDVKPVNVTCIHGGDPGFEKETPNYFPTFQITLQREDLRKIKARAVGKHIVEHLVTHKRDYINPYIDLSRMLENGCSVCTMIMTSYDAKTPMVKLDRNPSQWDELRRGSITEPSTARVVYHLPRLEHTVHSELRKCVRKYDLQGYDRYVSRTMRIEAAITNGLQEWSAPKDWHYSSKRQVCPFSVYKVEPVFRYIGCGYAITPTSTYPPKKAAHIWRWIAKDAEDKPREGGVYHDPVGAYYTMGQQAKDADEVLGHTAILIDQDRKQHYADIFGLDSSRGILFGWLRLHHSEVDKDMFSAFVLPGYPNDTESLPPFKRIHIKTYGFPKVIPVFPAPKGTLVPVTCSQVPDRNILTPADDFVLKISVDDVGEEQNLTSILLKAIGAHIVKNRLIHPLLMPAFKKRLKSSDSDKSRLICVHDEDKLQGNMIAAFVFRGQPPSDNGVKFKYFLYEHFHPRYFEPLERLPVPGARQKPAETAWIAPENWFEPQRPTFDPTGQYQAIDVMSYVGTGYVLPPWAVYPPDKAKFVWSRMAKESSNQDARLVNYDEKSVFPERQVDEPPLRLLDILGQTALFEWRDQKHILDVVGVDELRGLVFGFSRMNLFDDSDSLEILQLVLKEDDEAHEYTNIVVQEPGTASKNFIVDPFDKFDILVVQEPKRCKAHTTHTFGSFLDLAAGRGFQGQCIY